MKIIITGGNGFLGNRLATRLLSDGIAWRGETKPVSELILIDLARPSGDSATKDPRVRTLIGELVDKIRIPGALRGVDAVFHLAAVVSGQAEADFDLGMRVNLDATRAVLEACRFAGAAPKLIFTSSVAVFGGELPDIVDDETTPTPKNSYGTQKLIGEQLVADYTRRGFIRGRAIRLPTIVVRPGKPNQAASSFASSIIREPSAGVETVCPVAPETRLWLLSPDGAVAAQACRRTGRAPHPLATRSQNRSNGLCLAGTLRNSPRQCTGICRRCGFQSHCPHAPETIR